MGQCGCVLTPFRKDQNSEAAHELSHAGHTGLPRAHGHGNPQRVQPVTPTGRQGQPRFAPCRLATALAALDSCILEEKQLEPCRHMCVSVHAASLLTAIGASGSPWCLPGHRRAPEPSLGSVSCWVCHRLPSPLPPCPQEAVLSSGAVLLLHRVPSAGLLRAPPTVKATLRPCPDTPGSRQQGHRPLTGG